MVMRAGVYVNFFPLKADDNFKGSMNSLLSFSLLSFLFFLKGFSFLKFFPVRNLINPYPNLMEYITQI